MIRHAEQTIHTADACLRRALLCLLSALGLLTAVPSAHAQTGQRITDVVLEQEGRPVTDPAIVALVETRVGSLLDVQDVRETIAHIMSLNRFDDVQVYSEEAGDGVRVRYVLTPLHPVDRIEFRGTLGLPESDLNRLVVDRFGASPRAGRAQEITEALRAEYRRRGYVSATITPSVVETHNPDRATLIFSVVSGTRLTIADVLVTQVDADERSTIVDRPAVRAGQPFDEDAIERELREWENRLRGRGYYEARASHGSQIAEGGAFVTVNLTRGPHVAVTFTGDSLPEGERERLVPIRAEGSADEDLLEDSSRAIETYLRNRGYRDADALYTREEREGDLIITFHVDRGPRYLVHGVTISGNNSILATELVPLVRLETGAPFVSAALDGGIRSIEQLYASRGFTRVQVKADERVNVPERATDPDRPTDVVITIAEGPRTVVRSLSFEGNQAIDELTLRAASMLTEGQPFSESGLAAARERIDVEYRNLGYDSVVVTAQPAFAEGDTQVDLAFAVREGTQVIVDHIIIVGNRRISTETIQRELTLYEGQPLGLAALNNSRARLQALNLFRRIQIQPLAHGGDARRDVLIDVEEAPPTVLSYGGGLEGGYLLRTGADGLAEDHFEIAPRGFFQIGRRNLWGKNRSVDLFTRVSLRPARPTVVTVPAEPVVTDPTVPIVTDPGGRFYEYRVLGQFREPRVFSTAADFVATGIIEQAKRSSFNFARREVRAETGLRLNRLYSLVGTYSFQRTKLFDQQFTPENPPPLIDRLFPEVRLSKISASLLRDSRDDVLDASRGTFIVLDGEFAARALGSEVGFVQTYLQGFYYHRLPPRRRMVVALGARVGAAHGFMRELNGVIVQDLPASERFFAGGDTSVRGFPLDRLGNEQTMTPSGFPTGGNGVIVLNSELRVNVFGPLQAVGFADAGNVYLRAADIDITDLRPTAGFGVMYRSPVGPVRVDLGFNLDPRELVPGVVERRTVLHILLGNAF